MHSITSGVHAPPLPTHPSFPTPQDPPPRPPEESKPTPAPAASGRGQKVDVHA
jgi:hypothetical protein